MDLGAFFKAEFAEHHDVVRGTEARWRMPSPALCARAHPRRRRADVSRKGGKRCRRPASRD
jgi:hypothetical protein